MKIASLSWIVCFVLAILSLYLGENTIANIYIAASIVIAALRGDK